MKKNTGVHTVEGILSIKVTRRLIYPPYVVRGTVTKLISVTPAYCLKEPLKFGRRQGIHCEDPLRLSITDDGSVNEDRQGG
ncbi:hypothetical protein TNCV_3519591 [Trichonephila clavipes]|uniref:Uncharacterized protein n=1 Tax=Trichonephila clavipes TaxID=2585209 RepID=A0A8X6SPJ8_TRICX|nr:hypothetical protein TNCV_3519521 [Trichonephila clavipes]GFY17604.1 hypothetical protein TNCV_3519591 [Trichonephila clavipes]